MGSSFIRLHLECLLCRTMGQLCHAIRADFVNLQLKRVVDRHTKACVPTGEVNGVRHPVGSSAGSLRGGVENAHNARGLGVRVHNGLAVSFVKSKTGDGEDRSRVVVVFIEVACRDRGELF